MWGGITRFGLHLQNTCTIDNFLSIMLATSVYRPTFPAALAAHGHPVYTRVRAAVNLLLQGHQADAKAAWIKQLVPGKCQDTFGTENQGFVEQISEPLRTVQQSGCTNVTCPQKNTIRRSSVLDL